MKLKMNEPKINLFIVTLVTVSVLTLKSQNNEEITTAGPITGQPAILYGETFYPSSESEGKAEKLYELEGDDFYIRIGKMEIGESHISGEIVIHHLRDDYKERYQITNLRKGHLIYGKDLEKDYNYESFIIDAEHLNSNEKVVIEFEMATKEVNNDLSPVGEHFNLVIYAGAGEDEYGEKLLRRYFFFIR